MTVWHSQSLELAQHDNFCGPPHQQATTKGGWREGDKDRGINCARHSVNKHGKKGKSSTLEVN